MSTFDTLEIERHGHEAGVALVRLNLPHKLNPIAHGMKKNEPRCT